MHFCQRETRKVWHFDTLLLRENRHLSASFLHQEKCAKSNQPQTKVGMISSGETLVVCVVKLLTYILYPRVVFGFWLPPFCVCNATIKMPSLPSQDSRLTDDEVLLLVINSPWNNYYVRFCFRIDKAKSLKYVVARLDSATLWFTFKGLRLLQVNYQSYSLYTWKFLNLEVTCKVEHGLHLLGKTNRLSIIMELTFEPLFCRTTSLLKYVVGNCLYANA